MGIFGGNWTALGNAGKVFLGNFYLDENKSFFGATLEGVSRFTWQSIQTTIGYGYAQVRNTIGQVDDVEYLGGATFAIRINQGEQMGVTLGNFINAKITTNNTDVTDNPLLMHEYGHYIQGQKLGILYPFIVGIPSLISAKNAQLIPGGRVGQTTHTFRVYEMQANRNAAGYFGKYYGVDWSPYEPQYPRQR